MRALEGGQRELWIGRRGWVTVNRSVSRSELTMVRRSDSLMANKSVTNSESWLDLPMVSWSDSTMAYLLEEMTGSVGVGPPNPEICPKTDEPIRWTLNGLQCSELTIK